MISITLDLHFSRKSSNLIYDVSSEMLSQPIYDLALINISDIELKMEKPYKYIEININGKRFGF